MEKEGSREQSRLEQMKMSGEGNRGLMPRRLGSRRRDGRVLGLGFHSTYISKF